MGLSNFLYLTIGISIFAIAFSMLFGILRNIISGISALAVLYYLFIADAATKLKLDEQASSVINYVLVKYELFYIWSKTTLEQISGI